MIAPARSAAFAILLQVERNAGHCDELLRSELVDRLSQADRNLCTNLVMGTLRWQIALDARINALLARPDTRLDDEVRIALRLGAFQMLYLDRIPSHAAVMDSVELVKQSGQGFASGMVNAVLRKIAVAPMQLSFRRALPMLPSLLLLMLIRVGWWNVGRFSMGWRRLRRSAGSIRSNLRLAFVW